MLSHCGNTSNIIPYQITVKLYYVYTMYSTSTLLKIHAFKICKDYFQQRFSWGIIKATNNGRSTYKILQKEEKIGNNTY